MARTAIVTGSLGGIGAAVVEHFKGYGWRTLGVDERVSEQSDAALDCFQVDVSDADQVSQFFSHLRDSDVQVDALINNAAIQSIRPVDEISVKEWDLVMAANLRSAFLMSRAALKLIPDAGGTIVNISSVHALATSHGRGAYAASKAGVVGLTRSLALELAERKIRVNAVLPGAIDTPMLREGLTTSEALEMLLARTPLRRLGKPEDIARLIYFLASEDSDFITGQTVVADGGVTCRLGSE